MWCAGINDVKEYMELAQKKEEYFAKVRPCLSLHLPLGLSASLLF